MADLGAQGIAAPLPGYIMGSVVAGTIRDDSNTPCARPVYLLNHPADESVAMTTRQKTRSHPVTGRYSFAVASSQLPGYVANYCVLAIDDAADPYNAQVLDRITPA